MVGSFPASSLLRAGSRRLHLACGEDEGYGVLRVGFLWCCPFVPR